MNPKYPEITVKLLGEDGNAFYIIGKVSKALQRANVPVEEIGQFQAEATSGDYNNLLRVVMQTVQVE